MNSADAGNWVIAAYRPRPGKVDQLLQELREHLPILRSLGFATDDPPILFQAADGPIVEIFQWVSADAVEKAHSHPVVLEMWNRFDAACEYVKLNQLEEAGRLFPHFKRIDLSVDASR